MEKVLQNFATCVMLFSYNKKLINCSNGFKYGSFLWIFFCQIKIWNYIFMVLLQPLLSATVTVQKLIVYFIFSFACF